MGTTNFDTVAADSVIVGGNTLSGTELAFVDGVTAGTVIASKAVVVDASLNTTGINNITTTGNAALGNAAGDTFKAHGSAGTGAQEPFAAAVATDVAALGVYGFTEAQANAIVTLINRLQTCVVNHGLMASS